MVRLSFLNSISKCICIAPTNTVELYEIVKVTKAVVPEPVAEPAVNAVPEPVAEAIPEPVVEPVVEPVAEPIPEPVVCESLTEEFDEELTEVTTDHIMSQPAVELTNTIQYDICKIVICYLLTFVLLKSLLKEYLGNLHCRLDGHLNDHLERL